MIQNIPQTKFSPMNEIHENEVKILNTLLDKLEKNENIDETFNLFLDDVKNHFKFEENLMDKYNFFAKIPHKMEHDRILSQLKEIKNQNLSNEELLSYFTQIFIPWLNNHITTIDTVTAGFFDMIGIKE